MTASEDEREDITSADQHSPRGSQVADPDITTGVALGETGAERSSGRHSEDPEPTGPADLAAGAHGAQPTDDGAGKGTQPAKPAKKSSFWKELPILIVIALVLTFLIQTFVARVYVIPSGSMEQTLNGCDGCTGDRILVDKMTYDFTDPHPGDVIVFKGPDGWANSEYSVSGSSNVVVRWLQQFGASIGIGSPPEYDLVKRVIAVGGQTVSCCDAQNRVMVDGKSLNEPYVYWQDPSDRQQQPFAPVKIPQGYLWVMGDNRNNSDDSRFQNGGGIRGVVPVANVIGIARTIIWPPGRWRGIGEINPQTSMSLGAPAWTSGVPAGIGFAAAWPTLWLGRRVRAGLRTGGRGRTDSPAGGQRAAARFRRRKRR